MEEGNCSNPCKMILAWMICLSRIHYKPRQDHARYEFMRYMTLKGLHYETYTFSLGFTCFRSFRFLHGVCGV